MRFTLAEGGRGYSTGKGATLVTGATGAKTGPLLRPWYCPIQTKILLAVVSGVNFRRALCVVVRLHGMKPCALTVVRLFVSSCFLMRARSA